MTLLSLEFLKKAIKSRTIVVGCIVTCLSFIQGIVCEFPIPVMYQGIIGCFLGILIILLRMDTVDGINDK